MREGEGNVFAYNPSTGVSGPVCDDNWDINEVSLEQRCPMVFFRSPHIWEICS